MAADVAQRGSSRIKSYASAFSNILIFTLAANPGCMGILIIL